MATYIKKTKPYFRMSLCVCVISLCYTILLDREKSVSVKYSFHPPKVKSAKRADYISF